MGFTLHFLHAFMAGLILISPVLLFLLSIIFLLGQWIGRREGWTKMDAFYYSFITATTVGYGDFRPSKKFSKFAAIAIAFAGLLLSGILVAIGLEAVHRAYNHPAAEGKTKSLTRVEARSDLPSIKFAAPQRDLGSFLSTRSKPSNPHVAGIRIAGIAGSIRWSRHVIYRYLTGKEFHAGPAGTGWIIIIDR